MLISLKKIMSDICIVHDNNLSLSVKQQSDDTFDDA